MELEGDIVSNIADSQKNNVLVLKDKHTWAIYQRNGNVYNKINANVKTFVDPRRYKMAEINNNILNVYNLLMGPQGNPGPPGRIGPPGYRGQLYFPTFQKKYYPVTDPSGVVYNPSNNNIYVSNTKENTVSVIDSTGNITTVNVDFGPENIYYHLGDIYVVCSGSNTINQISGTTVVTKIPTGNIPKSILFFNGNMYVTNSGDNTVSFGNTTIEVGNNPSGIATDGTYIYVSNSADNTVSVISSVTVINTINVGILPDEILYNSGIIYVLNRSGSISLISNLKVVSTINLSSNLNHFVGDNQGNLYVIQENQRLTMLNSSGKIVTSFQIGSEPYQISFYGGVLYVTDKIGRVYLLTLSTIYSNPVSVQEQKILVPAPTESVTNLNVSYTLSNSIIKPYTNILAVHVENNTNVLITPTIVVDKDVTLNLSFQAGENTYLAESYIILSIYTS